jgi:hypothetical protein
MTAERARLARPQLNMSKGPIVGAAHKVTKANRNRAIAAGRERESRELLATAIRYSPRKDMIEITFPRGFALSIPRSQIPELARQPKVVLSKMTLSPAGSTILLDAADISLGVGDLVFSLLPRDVPPRAEGASRNR